ncbi:arginine vasopressin-induced protein 1 [Gymnodraco acuticeps]|uniref:Arginine vasopressin-induced protein 1 n=1 Tax=Gymnodraco acuticeps TaxID=8218 RepID=A0A6P8T7N1_GYMAC|nr:arginine vasopressin-induced protein 1 [Gymnodraco acuticeps]
MPPFPLFLKMDTGPASPPASMVAGPSPLWRLADRRSRKAGSANIFSDVNLWQLQRLFKAAGDQDAEQRAQLVWGQTDEAELAQALIGLRARSQRRGLKSNGREALGSHWLRAFNHLRIGESSPSSPGKDPAEENESEAGAHDSPESGRHTSSGTSGGATGATVGLTEGLDHAGTSERPARPNSGLKRGEGNNPERYLHRIRH